METTVSVIITVHNGSPWIDSCFASILGQKSYQERNIKIEVCVYNDASTDGTGTLLHRWKSELEQNKIETKILVDAECDESMLGKTRGVGYGRNFAIRHSTGDYLCFQDIDDVMAPERIVKQFELAKDHHHAIVGSKFVRTPSNSTCRFTRWANELDHDKLEVQIYTTNGPTIIMPTWFCHRSVYDKVGNFSEDGHGTPEDLIFFYHHLDNGGKILRVDEVLLNYTYHENATTFSISKEIIWKIRLERLIRKVLRTAEWQQGFTIWNAGKQGRRFFRDLPDEMKGVVRAFCDVDEKKIGTNYEYFDTEMRKVSHVVPIISFKGAKPPLVVCMKLDLTDGLFEANLSSLNLLEGTNYVIF